MDLPTDCPQDPNSDFLQRLHEILLETKIKEGTMVCNGCQRQYPIHDGIANMLLSENEIE